MDESSSQPADPLTVFVLVCIACAGVVMTRSKRLLRTSAGVQREQSPAVGWTLRACMLSSIVFMAALLVVMQQ